MVRSKNLSPLSPYRHTCENHTFPPTPRRKDVLCKRLGSSFFAQHPVHGMVARHAHYINQVVVVNQRASACHQLVGQDRGYGVFAGAGESVYPDYRCRLDVVDHCSHGVRVMLMNGASLQVITLVPKDRARETSAIRVYMTTLPPQRQHVTRTLTHSTRPKNVSHPEGNSP